MSKSEYSRKVEAAFYKWLKSDDGSYCEDTYYGLEIGFSAGYECGLEDSKEPASTKSDDLEQRHKH